ncbi:MAG: glycosyltransferase family 4 protein [Bacteroidia bacterium]|nr:glycosyltransferase family 4 protein [Bacteroidia bacterium]
MHICHITSAHPAEDIRIFIKECSSLAAAGHRVTLVAAGTHDDYTKNGVQIVFVPKSTGGRIKRMYETVNRVYEKALSVNADIYHFHDPELLRIALKLKKKGKKVIYDAHEDVPRQIMGKYWIPAPLRRITSALFEGFENRVARRIDGVLTATPAIRDRFLQINSNTLDINNFPLLAEFTPPDFDAPKENAVCYIGGITRIRGISFLVQAMEQTEGIRLKLAGNFSPEAYADEVKALNGFKKTEYMGSISRAEVVKCMHASRAGMVTFLGLPNHVDAQPNKMFEYMAAGIPVIGSHFPLWKEVIEKNHCGICVNPEDPAEIAAAITRLCNDTALGMQMGRNGRKAIEEQYSWEAEKNKLLGFYNQL